LCIVDHGDCRFGVKLFPLVGTISDNQAPLAAPPRIPKGRFSREFFCAGVDRLSPSGESAPTSYLRYALAINGSVGGLFQSGSKFGATELGANFNRILISE
jgi:hypothetical protein